MSTTDAPAGRWTSHAWQDLSIRLAVGLAFADASIVVLALPQLVGELDTTISRIVWVIMAYNLALIATVLVYLGLAGRVSARRVLLVGLALFGLASIGCGLSDTLTQLVVMRCVQGVGGGLLLAASLPLLTRVSRPGDTPLAGWAQAAAIGAAIGPAAGGLLTQVFDWRAIFLVQAPAAALAIAAVVAARLRDDVPVTGDADDVPAPSGTLGAATANVALALLSAGLIGALFLMVILLIDVWGLEPAAAALVVSAIPVATVVTERLARGRSDVLLAALGAVLLAAGLIGIAYVSHEQLGWAVVALALCGAGLGLAFTALTADSLGGKGSAVVRAGRTVTAREGGLVVGLLLLTPVFVDKLDEAPGRAVPAVTQAVVAAPLPAVTKAQLGAGLIAAYGQTPEGRLPPLEPTFDRARATADPEDRADLTRLQAELQDTIERAVTRSFRRPLIYAALLALLVLPVLAFRVVQLRMRSRPPAPA